MVNVPAASKAHAAMIEGRGHMRGFSSHAMRGETMPAPLAAHLLSSPLEYLYADHLRQRSVCAILRRIAAEECVAPQEAATIAAFLERDLILHHEDEERSLFPLLINRSSGEDRLEADLARLTQDHKKVRPQIMRMADLLTQKQPVIAAAETALLSSFAAHELRHLAFESGVVLPIARVRLTRKDLAALSRDMRARRGIAAP